MANNKMTIIASKGSLDMAYPPLILATTAAAMDFDVTIFFTFYGLELIKKGNADSLKISPLGNPAMPMPMPIPALVAAMPGMQAFAGAMMKSMFKKHGVASSASSSSLPGERREAHRMPDDHGRDERQARGHYRRRRVRRRGNVAGRRC
jgi:peroxiredoxin family protein